MIEVQRGAGLGLGRHLLMIVTARSSPTPINSSISKEMWIWISLRPLQPTIFGSCLERQSAKITALSNRRIAVSAHWIDQETTHGQMAG